MKRLLASTLFLFLFNPGLVSADDFFGKYEALQKAGDDVAIREFLDKAAETELKNPDYYAAAGNYWWGVAGSVTVSPLKAGDYQLNTDDFSIRDPKTGAKVGSIGRAGKAYPELSKRALKFLSDGARKFPERADIALGLAHVQKELGSSDEYVATLTALLAQAKKDPDGLRWMKGDALPSPAETFLPESIQSYTTALFKANTPGTDALCAKLLTSVTDTFPDHPYAYNLRAALADANGKPEEALRLLEIARQKDPDDPLILLNVADAYAKSGETEKAIATYKNVLNLKVNARSRRKAEAALKKLGEAGSTGADTGSETKAK